MRPRRRPTASTPAARGFESLESEVRVDALPLTGELPAWLEGSLIRTGPAKWEVGERTMNHWFDGLAMLHRFGIGDGSVSYASRFLETRAYRAARATGEISYSEFATDPCRSLFQRVTAMFSPKLSDNANVNLVKLGERFVSMTETPIPVQFDAETLATAGVAYDVPGMLTTAHPHLDRASRGMLNYAAALGPRNEYRFFRLAPDGAEARGDRPAAHARARLHALVRAQRALARARRVPVRGQPAAARAQRPPVHRELPLEARARDAVHADRPRHRRGPRAVRDRRLLRLSPRQRLRGRRRGGRRHLRLRRPADRRGPLPRAPARRQAGRPSRSCAGSGSAPDAARSTASGSPTSALELPRINYGRCNERPYRYVWGVGWGESGWLETVVKVDVSSAARPRSGRSPGCYRGRAGVRRRARTPTAEDDGVLLSVVLDAERGSSFLLVLDAATLEELARAEAPHHIPFGFHGQFAPV